SRRRFRQRREKGRRANGDAHRRTPTQLVALIAGQAQRNNRPSSVHCWQHFYFICLGCALSRHSFAFSG
ncbi:hypothetical protein, partial [Vibrio anguillarum]|uniref:hypothetical protein n=1 Tax=Vibrio anguillarum TaxID=55601 RepID=UPI001C03A9A4